MTATGRRAGDATEQAARGDVALLGAAIVIGAVLRLVALGLHPLWCDELATLQRLELPLVVHLRAMQGNHPLYEILLRAWAGPAASDGWIRFPSAVFGIAAVALTWCLLRPAGGRVALLASWLVALSPLHVMYSRIARPYALACVLALSSNLFLLAAIRRRRFWQLFGYAISTALLIYSNLMAVALWASQAVFLAWFYRRRPRRLLPWLPALGAVALMILPWMSFSLKGAVAWSQETHYTAQQLGRWFKAGHLALSLTIGETVHPLNVAVVAPAAVGFGIAFVSGCLAAARRRRLLPMLLLVQVGFTCVTAMYFAAAAAKHLTILLPAWFGLAAVGMSGLRGQVRFLCTGLVSVAMVVSLANYFSGREFTDADMVTPWREMANAVTRQMRPGDTVMVGYRPDAGARDMFDRYFRPATPTRRLDFARWDADLTSAAAGAGRIWLLLHDGDPHAEIEQWLRRHGWSFRVFAFQDEEHTLEGLREWMSARREGMPLLSWLGALPRYASRHHSPLYRLYLVTPRRERAGSAAG